jgi:hypothetical protein
LKSYPGATLREIKVPSHPLTELSDGQRFTLHKKLSVYAGNPVRIVLISNDPHAEVMFEQLKDIFKGWDIQSGRGPVSASGLNLPANSYLTSRNIASPLIKDVFSIFHSVGFELPLTPDVYMGPSSMGAAPDVVIVVL